MIIFLVMISAILFADNKIIAKTNADIGGGVYFYSSLAPYGSWIQISGGVTVWRPGHITGEWQPYRDGYWIWTNDGWYWESYEPFGYITYHYGRWYYDDYYGWIWVPDNQWAPAWVEWRYDNDYIGWAPLPPYASFSIGIGINFTINYYSPYSHWHFVRYRHFCDPYAYKYYVPSRDVYRFYNRTRYRTNYGYSSGRVINRGVDIDFVRKRSGRNIRERMIERVNDPRLVRNQNGRNSDRVRSYYIERDRLSRENIDGRRIERSDRRSSLDISRMGIDRRNTSSVERRRDTRDEIILNNREAQFYKRRMIEEKARSNAREREIRKERNSNFKKNRERSFEKKRNESPVYMQERKTQKPEYNRSRRQVDRNRDSHQNNRNRSSGRDKNRRGR
jgi:hypothetical protein